MHAINLHIDMQLIALFALLKVFGLDTDVVHF